MDLKDLSQHIRQVHFAICALSVGLLIVAETDQSSDRRLARSQLMKIEEGLAAFEPYNGIWDSVGERTASSVAALRATLPRAARQCHQFLYPKNSICAVWELSGPLIHDNKTHHIHTIVELQIPPAYIPDEVAHFEMRTADFGEVRKFWDALSSSLLFTHSVEFAQATVQYDVHDAFNRESLKALTEKSIS